MFRQSSGPLRTRTKAFALRVIRLVESLPRSRAANHIGGQLLRCGTSVGANYLAVCRARSPAEFRSKLGIVEEEGDESVFWMDEKHAGALIELAQSQFAVEDHAAAATKTFQSAVGACSRLLVEALLGQATALVEMNRREEAFDCLARVRWLQAASMNGHAASPDADDRKLVERWEELAGISP